MARDSTLIPVQICLVNSESTGRNPKIFRRESTLSSKSDYERVERRRSSLMSLFSKADKNDAAPTPNFKDEKHLELFKSAEFQAYLKEHNILTTVGLQVIFQQFLHDRSIVEARKSTDEKVEASAPVRRRKSSAENFLGIAGRCTTPGYKRRGTTNGSEQSHVGSENSLDGSIWSLDASLKRDYMSAIRGDTESLFQQPKEVNEIEQQVNDDVEEESMLKSFFRRSSDAMLASIDTSHHNRRDSVFSSLRSELDDAHARQWEGSHKVKQVQGVRATATDDSSGSACLEDLLKTLDDTQIGDDRSNNGEVEFFFPSRRRSMSFDDAPPRRSSLISRASESSSQLQKCLNEINEDDDASNNGEVELFFPSRRRSMSFDDAPPRRSSLISRASESSSQLQKCLNEINADNIRSNRLHTLFVDDDQTVASGNSDSVGSISSFASDQALLWKSNNVEDVIDSHHIRPKYVDLHYHPRKLSKSDKSCNNHATCGGQLQEHFQASRESLLVEWDEAKHDSENN